MIHTKSRQKTKKKLEPKNESDHIIFFIFMEHNFFNTKYNTSRSQLVYFFFL